MKAVRKDLDMMTKQLVRWKMSKTLIPATFRCNKSKWVFKIKSYSVNCATLVTCGFSQVCGFFPFMNDIMYWMLLLILIQVKLSGKVVDIKTAFLYWWLQQEIQMKCTPGLEGIRNDDCIILEKCIYGLVQAVKYD